jgi:hypothetical protein
MFHFCERIPGVSLYWGFVWELEIWVLFELTKSSYVTSTVERRALTKKCQIKCKGWQKEIQILQILHLLQQPIQRMYSTT